MFALEVDRERVGDEEKERESRGGLGRKRSKLLLKIVKAEGCLALSGGEERQGTRDAGDVEMLHALLCTFFDECLARADLLS